MIKHLDIRIWGRVQGVFFRQSAKAEADKLGICGFVRNEPDGSVCIEAEGEEKVLRRFVAWCKVGPSSAEVSRVKIEEGPVRGFSVFQIK